MFHCLWAVLLLAAAPVPEPRNNDGIGEPLPLGAFVRLGSLRDSPSNAQTPVAIMPDGKTIVTGQRRGLRFMNVETGKQTDFFPIRCQRVLAIAVSPKGKYIAATIAHEDIRRDGSIAQSIYVWDFAAKKILWNRGGVGYSYPHAGFAADGRALLVQRIDWEHGKQVEVFRCDTDTGGDSRIGAKFRCFAISPDGKKIAYGASDWTVQIQDASGWVLQDRQFEQRSIDRLAWSCDGRLLAIASTKIMSPDKKGAPLIRRVAVMEASIGKVLFDSPIAAEVKALAFSPDTRVLGIQAADGDISSLHFWESASGKELWPAIDPSWRLPIPLPLADGTRLTVQRTEGNRVLVAARSPAGSERWRWWTDESLSPAHVIAFADQKADRKLVVSGVPFAVFDFATGKGLANSGGHRQAIRELRFSPEGSRLLSIDEGNYVRAWRPFDVKNLQSEVAPRDERGAARFLKDGTIVFVGFDGSIRIREAANERIRSFRVEGIVPSPSAFDISPSGLLAARTTAGIALWDLIQGRRIAQLNERGRFGKSVRFSADERFLLAESADAKARLFAVSATGLVRVPTDLDLAFTIAQFSPDSRWLVGLDNSRLRVIDLGNGKNIAIAGAFRDFGFSPTDSAVAVRQSDNTHRLILLPSGQQLRSVRFGDSGETLWDAASACTIAWSNDSGAKVVFSPDGRLFAVVGEQVTFHEAATSKRIGQLPDGHPDGVSALAISPDGKYVATGGYEGTILLWDWAAACGLDAKESRPLESLWSAVREADAGDAYRAFFAMQKEPQKTIALLRRHLAPAARDFKDIRSLVEQLDADNFRKRDAASKALRLIGSEAEPFLRLALSKPTSAEAEQRINRLLADPRMETLGAEIIRFIRAIHLLETIGTPEAKALLRELADGDPQRIVTRAARANLRN